MNNHRCGMKRTKSALTMLTLPYIHVSRLLTGCLLVAAMSGCHLSKTNPAEKVSWTDAERLILRAWPEGDMDTQTTALVRHSANTVEVRFECIDDFISTPLAGHDRNLYKGDVVEIFIDPLGDGKRMVELQVNPNNDVLDLLLTYSDGYQLTEAGRLTEDSVKSHFLSDRQFNIADLRTSAAAYPGGYWVEIHIPTDALQRAAGAPSINLTNMRWNIVRLDHRRDGTIRQSSLVHVEAGCQHISPKRTVPIYTKTITK